MNRSWTTASPGFIAAVVVAIGVRLLAFTIVAQHPIVADNGRLISPSIVGGGDVVFYQRWENEMFHGAGRNPATRVQDRRMISGPVFPALLYIFSYEDGNSWPLATAYLAGGIGLALIWLFWLRSQGLSTVSLVLFALLPHPIYYMVCVTTELPFSIFFAAFFFWYFKDDRGRGRTVAWLAMLLLLLATRPNGLSVLAFVTLEFLFRHRATPARARLPIILGLLISGVLFGMLFYSYFLAVYNSSSALLFFGLPESAYVHGLFPVLPASLDRAVSLVLLLGAKVLYFVGLRPSYSHVWIGFVLLRACPGFLFLIALVALCLKGNNRHRHLVFWYMLPILLVASQDRYSLAIQPLLFYYFARAFDRFVLRRPPPVEVATAVS